MQKIWKSYLTEEDSECWKQCGSKDTNHLHVFCDFLIIKNFWLKIHNIMEQIFTKKYLLSLVSFTHFLFLPRYYSFIPFPYSVQ